MRKVITFLCAGVMAFSLTACGSSSKASAVPEATASKSTVSIITETPKPIATPTPEAVKTPEPTPAPEVSAEPEIATYGEAKQAILDRIDVAYTGLTSAGTPMYFLASSDCEYVALVLEDTDQTGYIKFIGSAVIDDNTGVLTVIDDEKGHTFGFTAEKQPNGSYFLDCGNIGECYLEPDTPGKVVDNIYLTFQNKVDVTDDLLEALAMESALEYLDVAYSGVTAAGGSMYYLASSDGVFAALIIENANEMDYIKFLGTTSINADGLQTVTDTAKNYTFGFIAEELEDGSYLLDCGEFGECYLEPDTSENVVDYILITIEDMDDITDEFMAKYGR